MTFPLEYHDVVNGSVKPAAQRSIPASLALLGIFWLPLLLASASGAQLSSGSASSAGSSHSGGAAASSVGSHYAPVNSGVTHSTGIPHSPGGTLIHGNGNHHGHDANGHDASGVVYYPYVYGVPIPYVVDAGDAETSDEDDSEYQGGPTIFDRRGLGADSYVPPVSASAQSQDMATEDTLPSNPEPPQPPTTLVFRDGHQLEVNNYAIVSQTLYDLTPGHPRKIALADLDLSATQKQNDDHGVLFQLPPPAQAD